MVFKQGTRVLKHWNLFEQCLVQVLKQSFEHLQRLLFKHRCIRI